MIGRRRKLDENTADYHAKRTKTVGSKSDIVVTHRLPTHRTLLYPTDATSDIVSVRIGTSIHGSQRTPLQSSSDGDHVSHPHGTGTALEASSAHTTLSVNEVLEEDADASSSIFKPLESSVSASLAAFEMLDDGFKDNSHSPDQRDRLYRSTSLSTLHSPKNGCGAANFITRMPPGSVQHHIPVSQSQIRANDVLSPASSRAPTIQRNGRLILPTSPLQAQASSSVALTTAASSLRTSDCSIEAQASNNEDNTETNSNEEEWRGFVDIAFTSDDMLGIGNRSSDILEITTKATNLDPTESGEWNGLLDDHSSSQSMLDSGYSCSDNTQPGSSARAPNISDGNSYSNVTSIALDSVLTGASGYPPAHTFNEALLTATPQPVTPIRPTEPSTSTDQDALANQEGEYPEPLKQETEEDPDSVWYRFVFGHGKGLDESGNKEEQERLRRESPVDSLIVEASESLSAKRSSDPTTSSLEMAVSSSPDPLSLPASFSGAVRNQEHPPKQPKVIFRKPIRFDEPEPRADTVHIGQNLRSSSPVGLHPGDKWRRSRAVRRRLSEMTWFPQGFAEDEDIEDEEDGQG